VARQNVFIVGATGAVGSELVRQMLIHDSPASHFSGNLAGVEHENPTVIVGVADSSGYRIDPSGAEIDLSELEASREIDFSHQDRQAQNLELDKFNKWRRYLKQSFKDSPAWRPFPAEKHNRTRLSCNFDPILDRLVKEGLAGDVIFVDLTANKDELPAFHQKIIATSDFGLVTANKFPAANLSSDIFRQLTSVRGRYGLRCTVMAGAQVVSHLMELYDSNEHVTRIEGCFSGSLGYICSELEKSERDFSDIVTNAATLNFTEPDPREDLSGMDVARKLVIVARCLGFDVELDDVDVRGLIDCKKYEGMSVPEFLTALRYEEDGRFRKEFSGKRMRYVATLEAFDRPTSKPKLIEVALKEISNDSPLGSIKGSSNIISIQSKTFVRGREYVIQAPGAGVGVTANGIRRDLLGMLRRRRSGAYFL
jgi:homoserine dehydrogenase